MWGHLIRILRRLQGSEKPHQQLVKTCETLQRQLATSQEKNKAWKTYAKALSLARKCDRTELTQIIFNFDPLFGEQSPSSMLPFGQALSFLLEAKPQTSQNLDAAWRLSQRLNEPSSIREVQQQICLQLGQIGDSNTLLAKLFKRHEEGSLTSAEISQIINNFLEKYSFELVDPWKAFLEQFKLDELPQIHQIYAVLERYVEASELAEAARDYRSAIRYLMPLPGKEIALRLLVLSNRLGDENAIAQAHQKVAESFWEESNYRDALEHFQKAGNLERASDCYHRLGELGLAIQLCPGNSPEWMQDIRRALENTVRSYIERQEFLAAVSLLKSVEEAWRGKSQEAEAGRTQNLLLEAVRTARSALTSELQISEGKPTTDLFKRWSLVEEAAGNYLEAGLQAEKAQDYFTASVLFEKAGAFGQALVALESASANVPDSRKKHNCWNKVATFLWQVCSTNVWEKQSRRSPCMNRRQSSCGRLSCADTNWGMSRQFLTIDSKNC